MVLHACCLVICMSVSQYRNVVCAYVYCVLCIVSSIVMVKKFKKSPYNWWYYLNEWLSLVFVSLMENTRRQSLVDADPI